MFLLATKSTQRHREEAAKVTRKDLDCGVFAALVHLSILWYPEPQLTAPREHLVAPGTECGRWPLPCMGLLRPISPLQRVDRKGRKIAAQGQREKATSVNTKGRYYSRLADRVHLSVLCYPESQLTAMKEEQFAAAHSCLEAPEVPSTKDSLKVTQGARQSVCCQDGIVVTCCDNHNNVTSRKRKATWDGCENGPAGNSSKRVKSLTANRTEPRVSVVGSISSDRPRGGQLGRNPRAVGSTRGKGSLDMKPCLNQGERRTQRPPIRPYHQQPAELTSCHPTQARRRSDIKKPTCKTRNSSPMANSLNTGLKNGNLGAHGPWDRPNISLKGRAKARYSIRKGPYERPKAHRSYSAAEASQLAQLAPHKHTHSLCQREA